MKQLHHEQRKIYFAVAALIGAAVIFTLLFSVYAQRFDQSLTEENRSRLDEVSGHMAAYMERAVGQQWEELHVVTSAAAGMPDRESCVAFLGRMAEELDFAYIGLAEKDGFLYSASFREPEDISEEDYFLAACRGEAFMTGLRRHIFWDRAVSGVILSVPVPDGHGTAVVAMISTTKLNADIQVDSFNGNGYSYVIDENGDQVLHARSVAYNNLFQAMENLEFAKGYSLEAMRSDIAARRCGMTAYSDLGVDKYAYYRPLSFNRWTIVSIVPKGVVTARTSVLSRELILMCTLAALVFLGLLGVVGILYMRLENRRQANHAKSEFLANMSHDMRTPMNAIMGMTTIAMIHANEPDTVKDCLKKINFSSAHLLGLINDVLDMSRIESGKMTLVQESFCLSDVLESVENMTFPRINARGQHFALRLHGIRHEYFIGDSLKLSQIFVNILTNAMKFTPDDGRITVDAQELPQESADAALFRFTFTDTGIGMKPAFLKDIFTPFVRERNSRVDNTEGSGLGMTITKQIIDLMGGHIEVRSAEGMGSVFTVTLPLSLDKEAPAEPPPPSWSVLLAGGHKEEQEDAVNTLEAMGLSAVWKADINSAAAYLADHFCQAVFVDRADYHADTLRLLCKAAAREPVLFLTAYDWEDIQKEASTAGVRHFVQKPLLRSTLCHALRQAAGLEASESVSSPQDTDLSGKNILLVDDNELNLEIACTMLAETGASVFSASDGIECVTMFEASPENSYDLILMDIQMPRLNGYEATKRIRSMNRSDSVIPILAMSANAYTEDMNAADEAGMDGYLTKPIDLAVWMSEIVKCLWL